MLARTNKPPESTSNTTSTNDITQQSDIIPNEVNVIAPNNKQRPSAQLSEINLLNVNHQQ